MPGEAAKRKPKAALRAPEVRWELHPIDTGLVNLEMLSSAIGHKGRIASPCCSQLAPASPSFMVGN